MDNELHVRVLSGPRTGAAAVVKAGRRLRIGAGFSNDLVLRSPGAIGVELELWIDPDSTEAPVAKALVREGAVELLGQRIEAGGSVTLPSCVPFVVGDSTLAFGAADDAEWSRCKALVRHFAGASAAAETMTAQATAADPAPPARGRGRRALLVGVIGLGVAAAGAALALALPQIQQRQRVPTIAQVRSLIDSAGFRQLEVATDADGVPALRGWLATGAERARLAQLVGGMRVLVQARTGEELAAAVTNVFRLHGARVEARHDGDGVVVVSADEPDLAKLKRAEQTALRDVVGLTRIDFSELKDPPLTPVAVRADPAKRVVSVVGGADGFVVTADGGRYFVGALLPTGHRLAGIDGRDVMIEKDGITTRLVF